MARRGLGCCPHFRVAPFDYRWLVATALLGGKYFNPQASRAVQLRKVGKGYVVRFLVKPGSEKDPKVIAAFKKTFASVVPAFGGAVARGELCNRFFEPIGTL